MSQTKHIDPKGHEEAPSIVKGFVCCKRCPAARFVTSEWARPCPKAQPAKEARPG